MFDMLDGSLFEFMLDLLVVLFIDYFMIYIQIDKVYVNYTLIQKY